MLLEVLTGLSSKLIEWNIEFFLSHVNFIPALILHRRSYFQNIRKPNPTMQERRRHVKAALTKGDDRLTIFFGRYQAAKMKFLVTNFQKNSYLNKVKYYYNYFNHY
jgi:hypothetical protein